MVRVYLCLCISLFSLSSFANIPLALKGTHAVFKDCYKVYSPVVAWIYKESFFDQLRFNGNYKIVAGMEEPQDPVAYLIKFLFPSSKGSLSLAKQGRTTLTGRFSPQQLGALVNYLATHKAILNENKIFAILGETAAAKATSKVLVGVHDFLISNTVYPSYLLEHAFTVFMLLHNPSEDDMYNFLIAMPNLVDGAALTAYERGSWEQEDIDKAKADCTKTPKLALDPENAVLLNLDVDFFGNSFLTHNYRKGLKGKPIAVKNEAYFKQFAQEMLNFFMFTLYDKASGKFDLKHLESPCELKKVHHRFKCFFETYNDFKKVSSPEAIKKWTAFIRYLFTRNVPGDWPLQSYEFQSNFCRVISKILNDPTVTDGAHKFMGLNKRLELGQTQAIIDACNKRFRGFLRSFSKICGTIQNTRFDQGDVRFVLKRGDIPGYHLTFEIESCRTRCFPNRKLPPSQSPPLNVLLEGTLVENITQNKILVALLVFFDKNICVNVGYLSTDNDDVHLKEVELLGLWKHNPGLFSLFFFSKPFSSDFRLSVRSVLMLNYAGYIPFLIREIEHIDLDKNIKRLVELTALSLQFPDTFLKKYDFLDRLKIKCSDKPEVTSLAILSSPCRALINRFAAERRFDFVGLDRACEMLDSMETKIEEAPHLLPLIFKHHAWLSLLASGQEEHFFDDGKCEKLVRRINFFFDKMLPSHEADHDDENVYLNERKVLLLLSACLKFLEGADAKQKASLRKMIGFLCAHKKLKFSFSYDDELGKVFNLAIQHSCGDFLERLAHEINVIYASETVNEGTNILLKNFFAKVVSPVRPHEDFIIVGAYQDCLLYKTEDELASYRRFLVSISDKAWQQLGVSFFTGDLCARTTAQIPVFTSDKFNNEILGVFKKIAFMTSFENLSDNSRRILLMTSLLLPHTISKQVRNCIFEDEQDSRKLLIFYNQILELLLSDAFKLDNDVRRKKSGIYVLETHTKMLEEMLFFFGSFLEIDDFNVADIAETVCIMKKLFAAQSSLLSVEDARFKERHEKMLLTFLESTIKKNENLKIVTFVEGYSIFLEILIVTSYSEAVLGFWESFFKLFDDDLERAYDLISKISDSQIQKAGPEFQRVMRAVYS